MNPAYWTPEMTTQLVSYLDQGLSRGTAAARLGVTRNAAIGRAWRIGYRTWDSNIYRAKQLAELSRLHDQGVICRMKNNGCRPPPVLRKQNLATKCRTATCTNNRLPGYPHGLCSTCNTERLNQRRDA